MTENDPGVTALFQRATDELEAPSAQLVAAGVTRGRALRRRHQIGTAVAAAAVFGVIGATAAVVPSLVGDEGRASDDAGFATQPSTAPLPTATPPVDPPSPTTDDELGKDIGEADSTVVPRAGAPELGVLAADIPGTVEAILGSDLAGEALTEAPYPLVDEPHRRIAHFRWDGMLTTVIIEPVAISDAGDCPNVKVEAGTCTPLAGGELATYWGPDTADQVTAHGVVVWSGDGYRASVISYNAPAGKDVPPSQPAPALTRADLEKIAASDACYR